jgi:PTH1 family peptidyl-tRNA hydrolase
MSTSQHQTLGEASSLEPKVLTRRQRREKQREREREREQEYSVTPSTSISKKNDTIRNTVEYRFAVAAPSAQLLEMTTPVRLLVCSIGNPGPYLHTLHSAGHTVLNSLAQSLSHPSFQKSRAFGNGLVSASSEYTLWQSTSLMNISGAGVAAAWKQFQKEGRGEQAKLVVVHDELELGVGLVKVRQGSASPKGHNGLKSINGSVKGADYTRIGIGIGRPESRDPNVVAGYVLRKMTAQERAKIEGCVGHVEMELRRLREG